MRNYFVSLLRVNLATLLALALMELIVMQPLQPALVKNVLAHAFVYANCTAVPAVLFLPPALHWVGERSGTRRWPLPLAVGLGSGLFTALGCLAGSAVIVVSGLARPADFWTQYLPFVRFCVLLSVVVSVGAFVYQSLRKQLREQNEILSEQRFANERALKLAAEARLASLESRVRPHFLFNTLNSISALIPVDPGRAEEMIERLARLLRSSLDNSERSLVPLGQELQTVRDYLDIEKVRFGVKLRDRIEVPPELLSALVPAMSLQSLVENSIKHGIGPLRNGGELVIAARSDSKGLYVDVRDSGPGFDLTAIAGGHGLDTLVSRLAELFNGQASLNVERRDEWCAVEVFMPLRNSE